MSLSLHALPANRTVRSAWLFALLLGLTACGARRVKPRTTLPETRIFIEFDQPAIKLPTRDQLGGGMLGDMMAMANAMGADHALNDNFAPRLAAQVRDEVIAANAAIPVFDRDKADLVLKGTVMPTGERLRWQLTETQGHAVILAGSERHTGSDRVETYARLITRALVETPLERYAGLAQAAQQTKRSAAAQARPAPVIAPSAATDGSKAFAVVIGIERYRDSLPAATHAEADARAFAAYAHRTLGVPQAHIKLLVGERASRADLQSMLEEWLPRNAREPGGRVFVYFSGHGAPDPSTGQTYLVPWDGDPAYIKTRGISVDAIYRHLEGLAGQQTFLFLDACFSGGGPRSVLAAGTRPLVPVQAARPGRVIAFAAAEARQTAGAARDASLGLFTRHLLAGLGGAADRNHDRDVTLAELVQYVRGAVAKAARLDNRAQEPVLTAEGVEPASVVLVRALNQ